MTFVDFWKAASIVLTGLFGILALLTEFKDKKTNRVTVWGRISLVGILVSSTFGLVSQLKETTAQRTEHQQSATEMKRVLTTLDELTVTVTFKMICPKDLKMLCPPPSPMPHNFTVPSFQIPKKARPDVDGSVSISFTKIELEKVVSGYLPAENTDLYLTVDPFNSAYMATFGQSYITITTIDRKAEINRNDGRLLSLVDLPGTVVQISEIGNPNLIPTGLTIKTKNKNEIRLNAEFTSIEPFGFRGVVSEQ